MKKIKIEIDIEIHEPPIFDEIKNAMVVIAPTSETRQHKPYSVYLRIKGPADQESQFRAMTTNFSDAATMIRSICDYHAM